MSDERDEKGNTSDAELLSWREEWQSLGGQEDFAAELVARAAKDGRRMRRAAAAEVLAAAFSSGLSAWLIIHTEAAIEVVAITAFVLVFNGAWLTHFFLLRAQLFATSGQGADAFVELTRRRLATELRWVTVARKWCVVLAAIVTPWGVWTFFRHKDAYLAEPWRAIVGFGGAAVIFAFVWMQTRRKERKVRAEEMAFERHLADVGLAMGE